MANSAGAPVVVSLRTIKSDVVVGLGPNGDKIAEELDQKEPGWKISGKYVSRCNYQDSCILLTDRRPLFFCLKDVLVNQ